MPQVSLKNQSNMKYFTMRELTQSATATRKGIDNTANGVIRANLTALVANVLDPLREAYGKPIIVTSGYRCVKLNRAVGGASKSQHTKGEAVDIRSVSDTKRDNKALFNLIVKLGLPFDQLINEFDYDWIHVSFVDSRNRRSILRAYREGGMTKYETFKPELK